jgi:hypothetical protein
MQIESHEFKTQATDKTSNQPFSANVAARQARLTKFFSVERKNDTVTTANSRHRSPSVEVVLHVVHARRAQREDLVPSKRHDSAPTSTVQLPPSQRRRASDTKRKTHVDIVDLDNTDRENDLPSSRHG